MSAKVRIFLKRQNVLAGFWDLRDKMMILLVIFLLQVAELVCFKVADTVEVLEPSVDFRMV